MNRQYNSINDIVEENGAEKALLMLLSDRFTITDQCAISATETYKTIDDDEMELTAYMFSIENTIDCINTDINIAIHAAVLSLVESLFNDIKQSFNAKSFLKYRLRPDLKIEDNQDGKANIVLSVRLMSFYPPKTETKSYKKVYDDEQ